MKQIEATPATPFYSVGYQYEDSPWTTCSFTAYFEVVGDKAKRTMPGTGDEVLAKRCADWCITQPGVKFAWVHKTTDCYSHKEVYKATRA